MAIEQKIPTPSEVKSSPVSFSQEELNELKALKENLSQLAIDLGGLSIQKIRLEEREKLLRQTLLDLEKKEANIATKLTEKYGKGSINLETGTFTPL
jgi:hypothetical protein